jgi:hypothetical protein
MTGLATLTGFQNPSHPLAANTTEETPLLVNQTQDIYSRFSFPKKKVIMLIVSLSGILTCENFENNQERLID